MTTTQALAALAPPPHHPNPMQSIILPRPTRRNRRRHSRARAIIGRAALIIGLALVTLAAVRCTLNP